MGCGATSFRDTVPAGQHHRPRRHSFVHLDLVRTPAPPTHTLGCTFHRSAGNQTKCAPRRDERHTSAYRQRSVSRQRSLHPCTLRLTAQIQRIARRTRWEGAGVRATQQPQAPTGSLVSRRAGGVGLTRGRHVSQIDDHRCATIQDLVRARPLVGLHIRAQTGAAVSPCPLGHNRSSACQSIVAILTRGRTTDPRHVDRGDFI